MKILVVEDDPGVAVDLRRLLDGEGHSIDYISDRGSGAVVRSATVYEAIIIDGALLEIGRFTLLACVRASSPAAPILVLNRLADSGDAVTGAEMGGEDFQLEQFVLADLFDRLHALKRHSALEAVT